MARYVVPQGCIVKGWTVRLTPSSEQIVQFKRDDGARRFACNWAVGRFARRSRQVPGPTSSTRTSGRIPHCASAGTGSKRTLLPVGGVFERGVLQRHSGRRDRSEELALVEDGCERRPHDGVPAVPEEGQGSRSLHVHHWGAAGRGLASRRVAWCWAGADRRKPLANLAAS